MTEKRIAGWERKGIAPSHRMTLRRRGATVGRLSATVGRTTRDIAPSAAYLLDERWRKMTCVDGRRVSRLIGGTLLLLVGGLFVLQNLGMVRAGHFGDYWPLLLVWVGLTRMLAPNRGRHFASGLLIFLL